MLEDQINLRAGLDDPVYPSLYGQRRVFSTTASYAEMQRHQTQIPSFVYAESRGLIELGYYDFHDYTPYQWMGGES